MTAKKKRRQGGLVYSTDQDYLKHAQQDREEQPTLAREKQKLSVLIDNRHRKGKVVTLVTGFVGTNDDLQSLGKRLKDHCGTGGTAKNGEIVVQGDFLEKIRTFLQSEGYSSTR